MARPIDIIDAIVRNDLPTLRRLADESPKALRSFVMANAISCDGTLHPGAGEGANEGGPSIEQETRLALHFAADCGRAEVVAELIDRYGVSVDCRTRYRLPTRARETPLLLASRRGHEDVVEVLLARGAEVEVRDAASNAPLTLAAAGGHAGIVRRLLDAGANGDAVDGQGRTPLHHAIRAAANPDEPSP
ncbi:MAG: ankyrin repeat domain-containing protein, partial [Phycisphaeraceae bacterium]